MYDHYIINCNEVIKPSDVYNLNINEIKPPDVKINKIRKHLSRYIRVSLIKSLSEFSKKHIINSIENRLNAKLKLQKLNRNLDLERIRINNSNLSKLMTLNINGVTNKLPELKLLLSRYQPGIICLQETGRTKFQKKLYIDRYETFEVPACTKGNGLAIGINRKTGLLPKIVHASHGFLLLGLKSKN